MVPEQAESEKKRRDANENETSEQVRKQASISKQTRRESGVLLPRCSTILTHVHHRTKNARRYSTYLEASLGSFM